MRVHETKEIRTHLIANKYDSSGIAANLADAFSFSINFQWRLSCRVGPRRQKCGIRLKLNYNEAAHRSAALLS